MLTPILKSLTSRLSPWEVFQNVYANSKKCFFLDSHTYNPPNQRYSYIGLNPILEITLKKRKLILKGAENKFVPQEELLSQLRRLLKKYEYQGKRKETFFMGGLVGFWGYEIAEHFEKIKFRRKAGTALPELLLGFFTELIVYDHKEKKYWIITHFYSKNKPNATVLRRTSEKNLSRLKRYLEEGDNEKVQEKFTLKQFQAEMPRRNFEKMVRKAKKYIQAGDIYQANLSQRFTFKFEGSPIKLYENLRDINPSPFSSFFRWETNYIVSSSPERLIRKHGNICETIPIAGTRPRRAMHKSERQLLQELRGNEKERAEHIMMVDLERNDLGRVCDWPSVKVKEMMRVEKYSHVLHLVSEIQGKMQKGKDSLDVIKAMFPGGTITGCPKIRCMEIIDELEPYRRGPYTGSLGYLDFRGNMDLNIVIRTLVIEKNKGFFQVGAGIVHDSNPAREYEETLHKGEALTEALVQASL